MELKSRIDDFSQDVIISQIELLLNYANRFYKRQFIDRFETTGKTITKFNEAIENYVKRGLLSEKGLPTVNNIAEQLNISPRYLSDLLKQECGKTALELIHIYLISEAKNKFPSSS